jgi:DNA-binding CsgD family transcriptional regulator
MATNHAVLLYQFVTLLVGFGAQITILVYQSVQPSPLGRRFLAFSVPYSAYFLLMTVSTYVVGSPDLDRVALEFWGSLVYFLVYALMAPPWTAFVLELLQRRFEGPWKIAAGLLSAVGIAALLGLALWPVEPSVKTVTARLLLQNVYVPAVLVLLAALVVLMGVGSRRLRDPWKRTTGRGLVWCLALSFPLFVLDTLWPWLQLASGWVPRGFNFQGVFFVAFHLYVAYRWSQRNDPRTSAPHTVDRARLTGLGLTFREDEVLELLFRGLSNQQIADSLGVGLGTVKNHVYRIYQKTGASSRKEMVEMWST